MNTYDLDQLLKSAKIHAYKQRIKKPLFQSTSQPPRMQADLEWTVGKTVCLIHKTSEGVETALGMFIEHLRGTSRWLRPTTDTLTPHHSEIVTGSWWLNPQIREIPVDSDQEILAIRSRFESLLREFDPYFEDAPLARRIAMETPPAIIDDPWNDDDEDEDYEDEDEDEDLDEEDEE